MDIFETVERLKHLSSLIDLDSIKSDKKEQILYIKEMQKLSKTIDIERIDMSTMDKWEFHD